MNLCRNSETAGLEISGIDSVTKAAGIAVALD